MDVDGIKNKIIIEETLVYLKFFKLKNIHLTYTIKRVFKLFELTTSKSSVQKRNFYYTRQNSCSSRAHMHQIMLHPYASWFSCRGWLLCCSRFTKRRALFGTLQLCIFRSLRVWIYWTLSWIDLWHFRRICSKMFHQWRNCDVNLW